MERKEGCFYFMFLCGFCFTVVFWASLIGCQLTYFVGRSSFLPTSSCIESPRFSFSFHFFLFVR